MGQGVHWELLVNSMEGLIGMVTLDMLQEATQGRQGPRMVGRGHSAGDSRQ